jgi:putative ABC transport system substrate-binding protein
MNPKLFWLLAAILLVSIHRAEAQQPQKVARIGYMSSGSSSSESPRVDGFRQALRDLGHVEGKTVSIEYRFAEGKFDQLSRFATELVQLKVDVLVTTGTPATQAARQATTAIPIVMTLVGEPVPRFVASFAKPGGNITGSTQIAPALSGKRLELLIEAFPNASRLAVFDDGSLADGRGSNNLQETRIVAEQLGIKLNALEIRRSSPDLDNIFRAAMTQRPNALVILPGPALSLRRTRIVEFAAKHRLPAIYPHNEFVEVGGLMSYAPDFIELFRRSAIYVDKILKGAKPADLPVEQPTKFELVINLKTAKQLGLTIPPNVLARADRVIR